MKAHMPIILLWLFFLGGQCIYIWLKAWKVVVSPKNPLIATYSAYFRRYSAPLVARLFGATCLFIMFEFGSGFIVNFSPDFFGTANPAVKIGIAGICGLGTDAILEKFTDKVPWLKNFIPDANGNGNTDDQAKSQGAGQP